MYFNGKVLLMEEHPMKEKLITFLNFIGMRDNIDKKLLPGQNISVFKKYGVENMSPVERTELIKANVALIHFEQNIFIVHKSVENTIYEGDLIYLLDSEIKEFIDEC